MSETHHTSDQFRDEQDVQSSSSRRRLILLVLLIAGASWSANHLYESYHARRDHIVRAVFAPELGPHSVIKVYRPAHDEPESLVEAIDLKTGHRHWQTWTEKIWTTAHRGHDLEVGSEVFALAERDFRPHERVRVAVHKLKDGALLWTKRFPPKSNWPLFVKLWLHRDLVLVFVNSGTTSPKTSVIAYEKQTGVERWRLPFSSKQEPTAPIFAGDHIMIAQAGGAMVIDRVTGQSTGINRSWMGVFSTGQSMLMAGYTKDQKSKGLFRLIEANSGLALAPVIHSGKAVQLSSMTNTYSGVGLSDTHVLSLHVQGGSKLIATPWQGASTPWTYELKDEGILQAVGQSFRHATPDAASFHQVNHRFLPLYVYYKIPGEDVERDIKLMILDVQRGHVTWEGPRMRQFVHGIKTSSVMYRDGVYRFIYQSKDDRVVTYLFLDGASGAWRKPVSLHIKFEAEWFSVGGINYSLDTRLFDGQRILGFVRDTLFSYQWKSGELYVQGSGQMRVSDETLRMNEELGISLAP